MPSCSAALARLPPEARSAAAMYSRSTAASVRRSPGTGGDGVGDRLREEGLTHENRTHRRKRVHRLLWRPRGGLTGARQGLGNGRGILGHAMTDHDTSDPTLGRIGAFSDGVFAFAITLLVVAIRIPHPNDADAGRGLLVLLSEQWRSYFAFVLSFMLGGINWANHRVMFATFSHAD